MRNILFVLSGPSGVGKGTMKDRLMQGGGFVFSVSCTTRAPRPGEKDGVDYYFLGREEFEARAACGEFLEYDQHFGNYYGTPRGFVEEQLEKESVLLDVDVVGALKIKENFPKAVLVFLAPPDVDALRDRLRLRGAESEEQMKIRLARVEYELSQRDKFDYVVVNDDRDAAEMRLRAILAKEQDRSE